MGIFKKNKQRVIGEVISHRPTTFIERQVMRKKVYNIGSPLLTILFVPTVSYLVDGKTYCIEPKTAYSGSGYEKYMAVGQKVDIIYEIEHPDKFKIKIIKG